MVNELFKALMAGTVLFSVLVHDRAQANRIYDECMAKTAAHESASEASEFCVGQAEFSVGQRGILGGL